MTYDPRWPRCGYCGVRHPADKPHLLLDESEVFYDRRVVFVGFREQCNDRAATIPGSIVRRRPT